MAVQYYKINYKSDFVLTINSDAGWAVPFCIKFWTGMPSHGYFAGFDGENYVNCRVGETPTQLLVMFDDHHMPIGPLRMQIAYHTTIEEFPDRKFDEVTNPTNVTVDIDGTEYQVMLDFTGETGAEIDFSMPSSGVMSVNGKIGYVTLNAEDVGAQPTIEDLSTIRSGAAAGATAVQPAEMTAALATKQDTISDLSEIRRNAALGATAVRPSELQQGLATKQNVIEDLATIRSGAAAGATAVQPATLQEGLATKQNVINDLSTIRSGAEAGATAVQPAALTPIENDIDAIEGKIPSAASASNQLADKAFVNSALSGKANTSDIPTALSQLSQDSTHRVVTDAEKSTWNGKQNAIDDLATIRSGAAAGATAVQPAALQEGLAGKQDTISDLATIRSGAAAGATAVQPAAMNTALADKQDTINTVNVTVDNNTGTPSGTASVSGSTLSLSFQNLKGATGATGATGPQGPQGERGLPGESGVTGDVSGFTVIQTIDPSATYGATDIAGAATVQATNAELTELEGNVDGLMTEVGGTCMQINLSSYSNVMFTINASGVWATTSNANHSIFVPMQDGEYKLTASTLTTALYTVLTSNATPTAGATPAYATGYSNRISIPTGGTVTVQGTSGLYLWMRNDTATNGAMPPTVMFSSGNSRIDDVEIGLGQIKNQLISETINKTLYGVVYFTIDTSTNKWVSRSSSSAYRSKIIPMSDGTYILNAVNGTSLYTVLSSNAPVNGQTPAFATGYNGQIRIEQGNSKKVKGVSGLYLYIRDDNDNSAAPSPEIEFFSYSERISPIEEALENIDIKYDDTLGNNTDSTYSQLTINNLLPYDSLETTFTQGKGVVADGILHGLGNITNSTMMAVSDYIDIASYKYVILNEPTSASDTTFGIVFYDASKNAVDGYMIETTAGIYGVKMKKYRIKGDWKYMRVTVYKSDSPYYYEPIILGYSTRCNNDIYIAASDSSAVAKASADFVCDGTNDEIELREACLALTGNGVLHMAEGNYYVDSFFTTADGGQPYIMKPKLEQNNITIVCDFNQPIKSSSGTMAADDITLGAIIRITDDCYNSLDSDTLYTIIRACASSGSRVYPLTFLNVRGIGFKIPDNQKQIICIDGYFATAMNINRCTFNFIQDSSKPSSLHNGVMNCIGIRGTQGYNYGIYNHIVDCIAWGCGQGFAIGGEHFLVDQCVTRFCRYGYTFNNYSIVDGKFVHPITLLNCADEASFNLPLFGDNQNLQPIYMYGFNIEHQSTYFNLFPTEGNYMRELTPGQWRGRIEYTIFIGGFNVVNYKLWAADGSGVNVKSINDAQKFICTTSERNSYYPTAGQIVYDTTLGKPVMCIDAVNKTWVDFTGATV